MNSRETSLKLNKKWFLNIMVFLVVSNLNILFTSINPVFQITSIFIFINILQIFMILLKKADYKIKIHLSLFFMFVYTIIFIDFGLVNGDLSKFIYIALKNIQNSVICAIIVFRIKNKVQLQDLLKIIVYAGIVLAVLGILEFIGVFKIMEMVGAYKYYYGNRVGAMWVDPNQYAAAIVFSYLCISLFENSTKNIFLKVIMLVGIVTSASRAAIVILLLITFINSITVTNWNLDYIKKVKKVFAICAFVFLIIYSLVQSSLWIQDIIYNSAISRLMIWDSKDQVDISNGRIDALMVSIDAASRNIFFGLGIGNSSKITGQGAHNMFIYSFAESGIIAFFSYIIFLLSLLVTAVKNHTKKFSGSKLSISLFMYLLFYSFFSHTLMINGISGILVAIILLDNKKLC